MAKNSQIQLSEFQELYKDQVVKPLTNELSKLTHTNHDMSEFLDRLDNEIPALLFGSITQEERYGKKRGFEKTLGVIGKLYNWGRNNNLHEWIPFILPTIEMSVKWIYKNKVESVLDKLGVEIDLDKMFSFKKSKKDARKPEELVLVKETTKEATYVAPETTFVEPETTEDCSDDEEKATAEDFDMKDNIPSYMR